MKNNSTINTLRSELLYFVRINCIVIINLYHACYQVVNLLAETQEQLRKQRKRGMPTVRGGSLFPSMGAAPQPDSIASELESSLYSELSIDSGIGAGDRMYVTKMHLIICYYLKLNN